MSLNFEPLIVKEEGAAVVVTISRPEAMNALNSSVLKALDRVLDWIETSGSHLRAMVLTGAGEKAFVAGADIKEFESMAPSAASELSRRGQALCARIENLKIPVIAAVNGFALGGGLELALSCDFIYASDNAKLGLPECTLGLMPGYGGTVRLPRRVGAARAREMTFTGTPVSAAEAFAMGLVNKVVPQAELLKTALETAKTISLRAPIALGQIKHSIRDGMNLSEREASDLEARLFGELFSTEDKAEGVKAFVEKRKPAFQGK